MAKIIKFIAVFIPLRVSGTFATALKIRRSLLVAGLSFLVARFSSLVARGPDVPPLSLRGPRSGPRQSQSYARDCRAALRAARNDKAYRPAHFLAPLG